MPKVSAGIDQPSSSDNVAKFGTSEPLSNTCSVEILRRLVVPLRKGFEANHQPAALQGTFVTIIQQFMHKRRIGRRKYQLWLLIDFDLRSGRMANPNTTWSLGGAPTFGVGVAGSKGSVLRIPFCACRSGLRCFPRSPSTTACNPQEVLVALAGATQCEVSPHFSPPLQRFQEISDFLCKPCFSPQNCTPWPG